MLGKEFGINVVSGVKPWYQSGGKQGEIFFHSKQSPVPRLTSLVPRPPSYVPRLTSSVPKDSLTNCEPQ